LQGHQYPFERHTSLFQMADHLHTAIAGFRDTMLTSLARLEFQLRDIPVGGLHYNASLHTDDYEDSQATFEIAKLTNLVGQLSMRIASLEENLEKKSIEVPQTRRDTLASELLTMDPVPNTRNILIASVRSTPALAAAVAAASVPALDIGFTAGDSDSESGSEMSESTIDIVEEKENVTNVEEGDVEAEAEAGVEVEEEVVETESDTESSGPNLKPIQIKGKPYYIDDEQTVYAETEDGYEEIGIYDAKTKSIVVPQEESEEEEDAIEVEDFVYKGTTYQRDGENNVYLDGEQIGTWNGKRIVMA
jgi:hypothetical protein